MAISSELRHSILRIMNEWKCHVLSDDDALNSIIELFNWEEDHEDA
jgi:hypothetical protein